MRWLPSPTGWRLSEKGHTPEALCELFRDWQRTQTQSSVRAPRSLRQQMDVRFCESRNHQPRGTVALRGTLIRPIARSLERAQRCCAFHLTAAYMEVAIADRCPQNSCGLANPSSE